MFDRRGMALKMRAAGVAFALLCLMTPAWAEAPDGDLASRVTGTETDLDQVVREISLSNERMDAIRAEIETLEKDQRALSAALVQSAKTERKLSEDAADIGERLEGLREQEDHLKLSLRERSGVLAEVLGALQRMGLHPPPAILVRPEDALGSVRSAILLGAVIPELRGETQILVDDLRQLANLSSSIDDERSRLVERVEQQAAEKERLALLIAEKEQLHERSQATMDAERARAEELASRAESLRELIESLEAEIAVAREAETAEREAEREAERLARLEEERRSLPETSNLAAPIPFPEMRGQAMLPVQGRIVHGYGETDETGMTLMGDMVKTQSGAIVAAPADGSVLYAGSFRSYGQLLILNVGGGYHIVLAGMDRISVSLGQSVLAGEPVGAMGEARLASAVSFGTENTGPQLYVELRKDGRPVDPAPWWADSNSGRTANGT